MSNPAPRRLSWTFLLPAVFAQVLAAGCSTSTSDDEASGGAAGAHPSSGGVTAAGGSVGVTAGASAGVGGSIGSAGSSGTSSTAGSGVGGSAASGGSNGGSSFGGSAVGGGASSGGGASAGSSNAAGSASGGSGNVGPLAKVVAGYYPNWTSSPVRIKDVHAGYNLIYLFAAKPVGGAPGTTGAVTFTDPDDGRGAKTNLKADIQLARTTQHRKVILSVGGQGAGMSFPNRQKSQTFVTSIGEISDRLGGIDGMDWNTFEADQAPDTGEMTWISLELKRLHPGFLITAPPAPWNNLDKAFCKTMVEAGAMDYAAPQYYDGPNLATQSYITSSVDEWVKLVGAAHLVVGFGIWDQANYMAIGDAVATWKAVHQKYPTLAGAFDWQIHIDEGQGWPFASKLGPLVTE